MTDFSKVASKRFKKGAFAGKRTSVIKGFDLLNATSKFFNSYANHAIKR